MQSDLPKIVLLSLHLIFYHVAKHYRFFDRWSAAKTVIRMIITCNTKKACSVLQVLLILSTYLNSVRNIYFLANCVVFGQRQHHLTPAKVAQNLECINMDGDLNVGNVFIWMKI